MTKLGTTSNHHITKDFLAIAGTLLLAIIPIQVCAGDLVSAGYASSQGRKIVMELKIQSPAPSTVIVIQNLPKGTGIKQSRPQFDKYDQDRGETKWLLRDVRPGTLRISMETTGPVKSGEVNGEIRYRDPSTGNMVRVHIRP